MGFSVNSVVVTLYNNQPSVDKFIKKFEEYLQRCIGVVAVMRLAIDPFPILLMDAYSMDVNL